MMIYILHSIGYGIFAWFLSQVLVCIILMWSGASKEYSTPIMSVFGIIVGLITFCLTL